MLTDGSSIEWIQHLNDCGIKTSDDFNSFKYGSFDLCCDYSISIRDISLTLHRSSIIVISSYEMIVNQHHSDVVLQSQGISLMRCNITCSLDFFCSDWIVCFISFTNDYIVTCKTLLLYYWRVRLFRFYLTGEFDYYWVIVVGESNYEGTCGVDVTACLIASYLAHS